MHRQRLTPFTLLEMLAVLMILMIVMLLAALSFRNNAAGNDAGNHASELLKFISAGRGRALQNHERTEILYDADHRCWTAGNAVLEIPEGLELNLNGKVPESGSAVFVFYPDGRAEPAHLELTGPDSFSGITCSPVSGTVALIKQQEPDQAKILPLWQKEN